MTTVTMLAMGALTLSSATANRETKLTLHLKGAGPVTRTAARMHCDAAAVKLGLPADLRVLYLRAGQTSLAILPVHGEQVVFAQVSSADGGRYTAGWQTWWTARETTFEDDRQQGLRGRCQ